MLERLKQLDRQTIIALVVAGVVSLLLFGAIVGVIRQAGWNEGFLYGLLASDGEARTALTPYLEHRGRYGPHGWGWHPFGFIGGIFKLFFFVFLLGAFFKFLGFLRWRRHGGPHGGPFGGPHWGGHHSPWGQYGQQPQPGQGSGSPEAPSQSAEQKPQNTSWINV
jgi:hypothetical protein